VAASKARAALLEGRFAEAETLMGEALAFGERAQGSMATNTFRVQLYVLRREQGRLEEMQDLVRRSVDEYPTYSLWRCLLTHMHAELGHLDDSRSGLDRLGAGDFRELPMDEEWLVSVSFLAETASVLRHTERAAQLHDLLLPYSNRMAVSYPEVSLGAVARYLALLAVAMGRSDDAIRYFEDALEVNERMQARPWLARTQRDYGRMLLSRGRPSDREKASELMATAVAGFEQLGMNGADNARGS
jgi:tetratricopeptide (TPR) repeat protein